MKHGYSFLDLFFNLWISGIRDIPAHLEQPGAAPPSSSEC